MADLKSFISCHCKNYNSNFDVSLQGVAAATVENEAAARSSRSINDSNVLCMGGLVTTPEEAIAIAEAWLDQEHRRPPGTKLKRKFL